MPDDIILLVEKESSKVPTFASDLERKGYKIATVSTGSQALKRASIVSPAIIVLNAASLGSSGVRISSRLVDEVGVPVIHILPDDGTAEALDAPAADIVLELPFTTRKLINRIRRLVPANRKHTIDVGPVSLAPKVRVVRSYGRETRLTPKAASLLQLLLENPNQTLTRGDLMKQVWNTSYVGDTRTLDVHIRWVREAIEKDPASPRHIITVRGVGYRFEPAPYQSSS